MKAHTASLIHAVIIISMSAWAYLSSDTPSMTALIPAFVGVVLILLNPGVKKENKVLAHVAVLLTLLIFLSLFMPLKAAIGRSDSAAIMRVALMILSSVMAMVYFIKSFKDARKRREQGV